MKVVIKKIIYGALFSALAIALVFCAWHIFAEITDNKFIVPSIAQTFGAFKTAIFKPFFWDAIGGTMLRCTIGYCIAFALAFIVYALSAAFAAFRHIIEPIVSIMRSLPAVAVTILLVISVGGEVTPIVLGVLVIFPIMYSAARSRTATVSGELKDVCVLCGASRWQMLKTLDFPVLAGGLPETLSSTFSYNVKAVVGAEILAQTADSLGMLMKLSQVYFQPAMLVAFVITAVAVSVVMEAVLRIVLKICLRRFAD